ncbi:iron-sulfur cluster-binding protein [hydrocarbon metagenome]|uniref:Iron-sulfur cluster-binding protein n=1 Tax=hydrocarbon metagenome TaxID=938273 RepID=A0A0W8FRB3_9ZZZZ
MALISLQKCAQYDNKMLKEKILMGLKQIDFDPAELKNKRVCLKPNLLMPVSPERAVTTHPEIFRAVAQIVRDFTKDIILIESPNFFALKPTIKKAGLDEIINDLGIEIADINVTETLRFPSAHRYKNIDISKAFFDVDYIINMPKLKTHGFTHYTGAVKNLFGVMPGLSKARMHMRAPSQMEFTEFLLDLYGGLLNGFEKPKKFIHIMDAVVGMEGEGPGPSGKPKAIGAVIVGEDAVALDYVAVNLVGLKMKKVFTITEGFKRGYGAKSPDEIQVRGESLEDMRINDFKAPRSTIMGGVVWPMTSPTIKNLFVEKPVPRAEACTLCYNCMTVCPAEAITKVANAKVPIYNYRKCIRCFCCMETCPEAAIYLKKGVLQWLMRT